MISILDLIKSLCCYCDSKLLFVNTRATSPNVVISLSVLSLSTVANVGACLLTIKPSVHE